MCLQKLVVTIHTVQRKNLRKYRLNKDIKKKMYQECQYGVIFLLIQVPHRIRHMRSFLFYKKIDYLNTFYKRKRTYGLYSSQIPANENELVKIIIII